MANKSYKFEGRDVVPVESQNASSGQSMSSGMDIGSGFSALGSQIHEDVIQGAEFFQGTAAEKAARERQARMDAMERQLARIGIEQSNRAQNLTGIDRLAQQRQQADMSARQSQMRKDFSRAIRG